MKIGKPKRIIEVEPGEIDAPSPAAPSEPERSPVPDDEEERRREESGSPRKKRVRG